MLPSVLVRLATRSLPAFGATTFVFSADSRAPIVAFSSEEKKTNRSPLFGGCSTASHQPQVERCAEIHYFIRLPLSRSHPFVLRLVPHLLRLPVCGGCQWPQHRHPFTKKSFLRTLHSTLFLLTWGVIVGIYNGCSFFRKKPSSSVLNCSLSTWASSEKIERNESSGIVEFVFELTV